MVLSYQTKSMLKEMTELSCSYNPVLGSIAMSLKQLIFLDCCYWILVQSNPAFSESHGQVLESFLQPSD